MCKLCDANRQMMQSCQDCGRLICFDHKTCDDVAATAYVTAAGDVFCVRCGREQDRAEEGDRDEWLGMWEDYPGEMLERTDLEVSDG